MANLATPRISARQRPAISWVSAITISTRRKSQRSITATSKQLIRSARPRSIRTNPTSIRKGKPRSVLTTKVPIKNSRGTVVERDEPRHHRAEADRGNLAGEQGAIAGAEQFYRTLIETLPVTVVLSRCGGSHKLHLARRQGDVGLPPGKAWGTRRSTGLRRTSEVVRQRMRRSWSIWPGNRRSIQDVRREVTRPVRARSPRPPLSIGRDPQRRGHRVPGHGRAAQAGGGDLESGQGRRPKGEGRPPSRPIGQGPFPGVLSHELVHAADAGGDGLVDAPGRPDLDPVVRETLEIARRNVELEARPESTICWTCRGSPGENQTQP